MYNILNGKFKKNHNINAMSIPRSVNEGLNLEMTDANEREICWKCSHIEPTFLKL